MAPAAYKDLCLDAVDPLRLGRFWAVVLGLVPRPATFTRFLGGPTARRLRCRKARVRPVRGPSSALPDERLDPPTTRPTSLDGALELADAGEGDAVLRGPSPQHTVWINAVPEPKTVKNRMHLDVHAGSVDELLALGATVVEEFPRWTVMADPEGGEFCAFVRAEPPPYRLYELGLDAADARSVGRWWADLLGCGWQATPLDETSVDREAGSDGGHSVDEGGEFVSVADIPGAPFVSLDVAPVPDRKTKPGTGERDHRLDRGVTVGSGTG